MPLPGPSELLAELASILRGWEEAGGITDAWRRAAEPRLEAAAGRRLATGGSVRSAMQAADRALRAVGGSPPTFAVFVKAAIALQGLDDWHEPLTAPGPSARLDEQQEEALRRLRVDGRPYNANLDRGSVIPASASGVRASPDRLGLVAELLHATAYLPPVAAAGDPDDKHAVTTRTVELRYVAQAFGDPRGAIGDRPRVSLAPVLQQDGDAEVELRPGDRYGVRVTYDPARLREIASKAMAERAHVLFMPEMTVDGDRVDDLASAIRGAAADHKRMHGSLPDLRLVAAGLAHAGPGDGDNSIVLMDVTGRRLLRQRKLCRWNLRWYHQANYQLKPGCGSSEPDLKEDIPGGGTVWIADVAWLGRFLTLICADMDYDKPGDLLVRSVAVDWLHAPIMDKSLAWSADPSGSLSPWIVDRAMRAAKNGVPKVVVTNSVLLTLKINVTNAAGSTGFPVLDSCAIGFMLDSAATPRLDFRQVEIPVPCAGPPIVETFSWMDGFVGFPPATTPSP